MSSVGRLFYGTPVYITISNSLTWISPVWNQLWRADKTVNHSGFREYEENRQRSQPEGRSSEH